MRDSLTTRQEILLGTVFRGCIPTVAGHPHKAPYPTPKTTGDFFC